MSYETAWRSHQGVYSSVRRLFQINITYLNFLHFFYHFRSVVAKLTGHTSYLWCEMWSTKGTGVENWFSQMQSKLVEKIARNIFKNLNQFMRVKSSYDVLSLWLPESVVSILATIYNNLFLQSLISPSWKMFVILPIPKSNCPGALRSISLASCNRKTFETILKNQLTYWLEKNCLFPPRNVCILHNWRACVKYNLSRKILFLINKKNFF